MFGFTRVLIGVIGAVVLALLANIGRSSDPMASTNASGVFSVLAACVLASISVTWGIEPAWDYVLRRLGVASILRRHLTAQDEATAAEHRVERMLRHPRRWAKLAKVSGEAKSQIVVRNADGSSRDAVRTIDTFPSCSRVWMTELGPCGEFNVARGTIPSQWSRERIATALGRHECRLTVANARTVQITVITRDPLQPSGVWGSRLPPQKDSLWRDEPTLRVVDKDEDER